MSDIDSQQRIRARFVTKHDIYRVTDVAISVPLKLNRSGLTDVIYHLLGSDYCTIHTPSIDLQATQFYSADADAIDSENNLKQFDFLINDQILLESLHSFVRKNAISTEDVIEIEYMPLVSISGDQIKADLQAWVGCIDASVHGLIFTGCYDGTVKVIDSRNDLKILNSITAHQHPIRSIHATGSSIDSSFFYSLTSLGYMCTRTNEYICMYTCTYIHTYIHTCMHEYVSTFTHICTHRFVCPHRIQRPRCKIF